METPLKINFIPEKKDYIRASRVLALKTPVFILLAGVTILAMIASVVMLFVGLPENSTLRSVAGISLVFGAFFLANLFILIPFQLSRAYKKNEYLQEERGFVFADDKATMTMGENGITFAWENFKKVIDGGDLYVLVYDDGERFSPFLPKRAFAQPADEAAFLQLLAEKSISVK